MRMLSYKKGSRGDGSLLQNQFTSYLVTSVHRRRKDILIAQMRHAETLIICVYDDAIIVGEKKYLLEGSIIGILKNKFITDELDQ